jgi:Leucine-rich repeat (LRR) protein
LELQTIPSTISSLFPTLKKLNLRGNQLVCLPEDFCTRFTKLVALNISQNKLAYLPHDIGNMRQLQKLLAHTNELKSLPKSFCCIDLLEELNLADNQLQSLDEELGLHLRRLRVLNISKNHLKEIPTTFADLPMLRIVDLRENVDIEKVPEKIRRIHEKNVILHSRFKRRALISRALKVRRAVSLTLSS